MLKELIHKISKPQEQSLKLQSMRAAFWSILGKGGSHIVRMAGSLILTRILFPEAFGLMATATTILTMIQLFADTGVRTVIIQNPRGAEPEFLHTAYIISIGRGALLFSIVTLLAWPMASLYDQPDLKGLLLIIGLSPLLLGFENPALALHIKHFRVEKQVAFELGTQILGLLTSIILAFVMRSVYALAIGTSVSALYRVIASYMVHQHRPRFCWDKTIAREIFHFGKFIFINTMITWAATNVDVLMIGKFLDMENLGFYSLGRNFGLLVSILVYKIVSQSYLPAVSSVAEDLPRVMRIFKRTQAFFLALAIPASMMLALFADDIIRLLYDPRYQAASVVFFWIACAGIFQVSGHVSGYTFIAMGKPVYETIAMGAGLILVMIFVPLGSVYGGLSGASVGMFAALISIVIVESILLIRGLNFTPLEVLRPWAQALIVSASISGIFLLLRPWLINPKLYNLPLVFVIGVISLLISAGYYRLSEGPYPFRDFREKT
ncbi:oligosaccharide flippase family protein [Desulfococcaceae bacterium HSG9]|nr:oligosaccharide flippase family protein [Desulfococcaceae bacterium HSG9]